MIDAVTRTILLVEDEPAHAELIRRVFERAGAGYRLIMAHSLAEAREQIASAPPDLVFVDYLLPDGDGLDLLTPANTAAFPIVILTSQGSEQVAVNALKLGALDYVIKSDIVFTDMPRIADRVLRDWSNLVERRRVEAELREREETFRTMMEMAAEGILLLRPDGIIEQVNRYVENALGVAREQLLDAPVSEYLPITGEDLARASALGGRADDAPGVLADLRQATCTDGRVFPLEISLTPIRISGSPRLLCFVQDVTERQQLEAQRLTAHQLALELEKERELIQLKQQFMSMVSHEYRTPLAIILSSTEMTRNYFDRLPRESLMAHLGRIAEQVAHMIRLLENVMRITKGDSDLVAFTPQPFDLVAHLDGIVGNQRLIDAGQHQLVYRAPDDAVIFNGDAGQLELAFSNLISNALKYSPVGTTVTVTLTCEDDWLVVAVDDEGIGIPEADHGRLFEPFNRGQNAQHIGGTGLGLAIVRQSIERHGGTIRFQSQPGATTFTVRLPLT
jgi:PAS domain S-box-containing protein